MIQVENLVKTFDGFRALDGADFHVKKGAIYGLVGPNGAGKSTLIRHLTGIYKQDEGSVLIDGEPVFENPAVKEKIAYIPDDLFYFAQADTMEMKKFYEGIYPNFDAGLFEKIREAFPSIDTKQTIRRLSKGGGLFTWDKPSYACLATRIPTGCEITAEKLQKTEAAENFMFSLGFSDFRVRMMPNGAARLQVPAAQLPLVMEKREEILAELKKSYPAVLLDLEVRG